MNTHLFYLCRELKLEKHKKSGIIFSRAIKHFFIQANVPLRLSDL